MLPLMAMEAPFTEFGKSCNMRGDTREDVTEAQTAEIQLEFGLPIAEPV
jgi:hypothetical protein